MNWISLQFRYLLVFKGLSWFETLIHLYNGQTLKEDFTLNYAQDSSY